jgi:hypothetical protein
MSNSNLSIEKSNNNDVYDKNDEVEDSNQNNEQNNSIAEDNNKLEINESLHNSNHDQLEKNEVDNDDEQEHKESNENEQEIDAAEENEPIEDEEKNNFNDEEDEINIEAKNESYYNHMKDLTQEDLDSLFEWLGTIKFSRKIIPRTLARDFSDGILYAEILKHYFPKFVDLHNFIPTLNAKQKQINWHTINNKILRKISLEFKPSAIQKIIGLEKGFIEKHLFNLKERVSSKYYYIL